MNRQHLVVNFLDDARVRRGALLKTQGLDVPGEVSTSTETQSPTVTEPVRCVAASTFPCPVECLVVFTMISPPPLASTVP
jgi:hypothetical protein